MPERVHEAIFSGWQARASNLAVVTRRTTGLPEKITWAELEAITQAVTREVNTALRDCLRRIAAVPASSPMGASPDDHHAGTRVAILAANSAAWVASFAAVSWCSLVAVPLNLQWSPEEAARALADCGAPLVLVDAAGHKLLEAVSTRLREFNAPQIWALDLPPIGSSHHNWKPVARPIVADKHVDAHNQPRLEAQSDSLGLTHGRLTKGARAALPPKGTLTFLYTSGTTGAPKGVMHDHTAHLLQARCKIEHGLYSTTPSNATTVLLCPAPLYHVGGLNSALACLLAQGTLVFPAGAADAKAAIVEHNATALVVVPALLQSMMGPPQEVADQKLGDLQSARLENNSIAEALQRVQCIVVGGQALSSSLYRQCKTAMPHARVVQTYAQTEACSSITFHDLLTDSSAGASDGSIDSRAPDCARARTNGSSAIELLSGNPIGSPAASFVEVALYRPSFEEDGSSNSNSNGTADDVPMELITRGPHVMLGYWRQPEATAAAMLPGGWLRTGDLAIVDCMRSSGIDSKRRGSADRYRFVGRLKDLIKSGGENVVSSEVEGVLSAHSSVAAAAVFGVPDDRWGERVVAALVLRTTHLTTVDASVVYDARAAPHGLHTHCVSRLSGFKIPKQFLVVPASRWPTTATGKVQKHKLRGIFLKAHSTSTPGLLREREIAQNLVLRSRL